MVYAHDNIDAKRSGVFLGFYFFYCCYNYYYYCYHGHDCFYYHFYYLFIADGGGDRGETEDYADILARSSIDFGFRRPTERGQGSLDKERRGARWYLDSSWRVAAKRGGPRGFNGRVVIGQACEGTMQRSKGDLAAVALRRRAWYPVRGQDGVWAVTAQRRQPCGEGRS